MGHAEIAQAPCQRRDDGKKGIGGRGIGADAVALGHGQIARQGFGVFHYGTHAPRPNGGVDQHEENGNGHDNALYQIRNGSRQKSAGSGVAHDNHSGDQHGCHVVDAEQAGKQLAAGGEAGSGIGNKENNDDHRGQGREDAFFIMEALGKELGDGIAFRNLGVAPQTAGGEKPVEVSAHSQTDGRPAHIRRAGQVGKARQTHEQIAGHIGGLGAHGGHQWAQGPSAQVEVGGGGILFGAARADPEHTQQVYKDCNGDANGRGHFTHPFS